MKCLLLLLIILLTPFQNNFNRDDCLKVELYLEINKICISQLDAFRMIERWPNYGGRMN